MQQEDNIQKKSLFSLWKSMKWRTRFCQVFLHLFAFAGMAILGAWAIYQLGLTNDGGSVDSNNRYLADYRKPVGETDSVQQFNNMMDGLMDLALLSKFYPENAHLIYEASQHCQQPDCINRMVYAANMYLQIDSIGGNYNPLKRELDAKFKQYPAASTRRNLIPWMNDSAWVVLKEAIVRDKEAINKAAELTGVESRLIVSCLVGEQIRLFNSKREMYKKYLGPMKVLSVQSKFSWGINGVKEATAMAVERNLKDSLSIYYMGEKYENILDFQTEDVATERFDRLTDYHNHLYSYIYTGCILKQTMLQWQRSGYDISDRPDILFTLFNLGFQASKPGPSPRCGGSTIEVCGERYTFGVIGNDFYFSGELAEHFPILEKPFFD